MHENASRGDFAENAHLLHITAIAVVVGGLSTVTAYVLLHLINFFTVNNNDCAAFTLPT